MFGTFPFLRTSVLAFTVGCSLANMAQTNISFVGNLNYQDLRSSNLSNLWGYTDEEGNEYALVGVNGSGVGNPGGISVVDLSDPTDPVEIFFFPGPPSIWREVKVWNDHAYITTEAESGGITIVDLSALPQSTALNAVLWNAPDWETSHSLFIDENGRLYLHGADRGNGGVIMYDLTQDPMEPVEVGEFDNWYCHDSYARGDTLYGAHVYDGFLSIVDVSDPAAPVLLGTQNTPNNFTHNVWLDDSGDHIFTTDERTDSYVGSYDVSDPSDITFLDKLQSDPGSGTVPHNTYWLNHFLVTSYYTYGVVIYDALRPDNLVEVGHYDTSPFSGDGFFGAWGVYPYFNSQRLIISDIEEGLFILDPTYVRACWLEGLVTNAQTTAPVNAATLTIVGIGISDQTAISGEYATGYHTAGTYTVTVSAPGYVSQTITGVQLQNGELTILNVALEPLVSFVLNGQVLEVGSGLPIENAQVQLRNADFDLQTISGAGGSFQLPTVFADSYDIKAGRWGWNTVCLTGQSIVSGASVQVELPKGYQDEFTLDLGWNVTSTASAGIWERGTPVGTNFDGQSSNPGVDVPMDCGTEAYVTGNGGGGAGDDDVDDGATDLVSPTFDVSGMIDPHVTYYRWFFNDGGSGSPNDRLTVFLDNGTTTATVETVLANSPGVGTWFAQDIRILDHLPLSANMTIRFSARDDAPGHLVEAGVDLVRVVEMSTIGIAERAGSDVLDVWPVPNSGAFQLTLNVEGNGQAEIVDAAGRVVFGPLLVQPGDNAILTDLPDGLYTVVVRTAVGRSVRKVLIAR